MDFDRPGVDNSFDCYRSRRISGIYEPAQGLVGNIKPGYNDYVPFIDPDEGYIIFRLNRPGGYGGGDLYIRYNKNESWTEPLNPGPQINSDQFEGWPYVSPDEEYLFLSEEGWEIITSILTGEAHG